MGSKSMPSRIVNSGFLKYVALAAIALSTYFLLKDAIFAAAGTSGLFSDKSKTWSVEEGDITTNHTDCRKLPGADRVLVILKTGGTAAYERLPIHFETTFKCMPNYMILSDLEDTIAGQNLTDVLKLATPETRTDNQDFKLYHQIQEYHATGQDLSSLDYDKAWTLDKYKFMPMMHAVSQKLTPNIDWIFMMEADTSLSWLNLLLFLRTMDPKEAIYTGAPAMLGPTIFAHGGSGIVMSRAAVDKLEETRLSNGTEGIKAYDQKWEEKNKNACCGDAVLAMAFLEAGIDMTRSWPLIQGESLLTIGWTEENWCAPAITWHHIKANTVNAMWKYEQNWLKEHGAGTPFLYRDVFEDIIRPHLVTKREDWDNLASGQRLHREDKDYGSYDAPDKEAVENADACANACRRRIQNCVQWKFKSGNCIMDGRIRFGNADLPKIVVDDTEEEEAEVSEDGKVKQVILKTVSWTSGWNVDRVGEYVEEKRGCSIRWSGRPLHE